MKKLAFCVVSVVGSFWAADVASADVGLTVSAPRHDMALVMRASADRYVSVGEGTISTRGCTVSSDGMAARIELRSGYRQSAWLVFLDASGEVEGECEVESGARRPEVRSDHAGVTVIRRQVATTDGSK